MVCWGAVKLVCAKYWCRTTHHDLKVENWSTLRRQRLSVHCFYVTGLVLEHLTSPNRSQIVRRFTMAHLQPFSSTSRAATSTFANQTHKCNSEHVWVVRDNRLYGREGILSSEGSTVREKSVVKEASHTLATRQSKPLASQD